MLNAVTPMILTFNEEPNIGRCLAKLAWATEIVVVDSYSTDGTLAILGAVPAVRLVQRSFESFAQQCNFGIEQVSTPWVLALDADYILSDALIHELSELPERDGVDGYFARFVYRIAGRDLRGTLYPDRQVLFRRGNATFVDDGHAHRLVNTGMSARLREPIYHDDRKPLGRWISDQDRYALQEADKLNSAAASDLNTADRLRRLKFVAPFAVLVYCLVMQRGILDGWAGIHYALQRLIAESLLSIRLIEISWKEPTQDSGGTRQ